VVERRHVRPPILRPGAARPGDVVGRYHAALEAGDAGAMVNTLASARTSSYANVREPRSLPTRAVVRCCAMSPKAKGGTTAGELMAQLEADPEYVARRDANDQQRRERLRRIHEAARPLFDDLASAGHPVRDVYLLKAPYPTALPVLAAHLRRDYPDLIRAGIARMLGVREADFAWNDLAELYRNIDANAPGEFKQALAASLSRIASAKRLPELREMLRDRSMGVSRILFFQAFMRLRAPDRWKLVEQSLADDDLKEEAAHLMHQKHLRTSKRR
jgi:hypothetical protein